MACKAEQSLLPSANASEPDYLRQRRQIIATALTAAQPVITLSFADPTNPKAVAQKIALMDSKVQAPFFDDQTKAPLLNEVFGIYPLRPSDLPPNTAPICADGI